jgi:hypothetical protein
VNLSANSHGARRMQETSAALGLLSVLPSSEVVSSEEFRR